MSDRYTPAEALDLLVDSFDREPDGWSAIVEDAAAEPARRRGVRGIPSLRRGTRIRLGLLVAGVAAAAALIVTSPWKTTGPAGISDAQAAQILRNVQAAAAPRPGWIYHRRMRQTFFWIPKRKSDRPVYRSITSEVWAQTASPYHKRDISRFSYAYPSRTLESGATGKPCAFYYFDPATKGLYRDDSYHLKTCLKTYSSDVVAKSNRKALAAGQLKVDGLTRIKGVSVYRLETIPKVDKYGSSLVIYVDAKSYRTVRQEETSDVTVPAHPWGYTEIREYFTDEYLRPTAANLALTDIRAQHSDAPVLAYSKMPVDTTRNMIDVGGNVLPPN